MPKSIEENKQIAERLAVMFTIFNKEPTKGMIQAFMAALDDVPTANLIAGIAAAIKFCKFCPSPAELREKSIVASGSGDAHKAWAAAMKAASSPGARAWVRFDDPKTSAAIKESAGTWSNLCRMPAEQLPFVKNAFVAAYERAVHSGVSKHEVLPGEGKDETPYCVFDSGKVERLQLTAPAPVAMLESSSSPNIDREQLARFDELRAKLGLSNA